MISSQNQILWKREYNIFDQGMNRDRFCWNERRLKPYRSRMFIFLIRDYMGYWKTAHSPLARTHSRSRPCFHLTYRFSTIINRFLQMKKANLFASANDGIVVGEFVQSRPWSVHGVHCQPKRSEPFKTTTWLGDGIPKERIRYVLEPMGDCKSRYGALYSSNGSSGNTRAIANCV
jgi:hypothetical protein